MTELRNHSPDWLPNYRALRKQIKQRQIEHELAHRQLEQTTERIESLQQLDVDYEQAFALARVVATGMQEQAQTAIADVVTKCLQAVFGSRYSFQIDFVEQKNRTSCRFVLKKGAQELDPLTETGGGVVDIITFALRVAVLCACKPARRRLIIADEPFRFVSHEYRAALSDLLTLLSNEMGIQFVIVTHIQELELGTVYRI